MVGPKGGFLERRTQYPFADLADDSRFLGERDELGRRNGPARRMLPADECFESGDLFSRGTDDRLVMNGKLTALDGLPEIIFKQLPLGGFAVHRRLVETVLAAPRPFGGVEREIGIADQCVRTCTARVADHDANGGSDRNLVALDRVGPRNW